MYDLQDLLSRTKFAFAEFIQRREQFVHAHRTFRTTCLNSFRQLYLRWEAVGHQVQVSALGALIDCKLGCS